MQPTSILRAPLPLLRTRLAPAPAVALGLRPFSLPPRVSPVQMHAAQLQMQMQRRWETQDNRGGRSKLRFRFGLKDLPVEIYPILFVVAVAVAGAVFAVVRHLYLDGFRLGAGTARGQSGPPETKYE